MPSSYNPQKHHRRSIRLKGYDYSQQGLFFITICIHHRLCLLGDIVNKQMILNDAGTMIEKWYYEMENKFPGIKCHEHITMPNHFHCIVENVGGGGTAVGAVGGDLCVRPDTGKGAGTAEHATAGSATGAHTDHDAEPGAGAETGGHTGPPLQHTQPNPTFGTHAGSPLGTVVQWFKTMTTNEYIRHVKRNHWPAFEGKLWQRDYWEHIIRNERSCFSIAEYINNNPLNWEEDSLHP